VKVNKQAKLVLASATLSNIFKQLCDAATYVDFSELYLVIVGFAIK